MGMKVGGYNDDCDDCGDDQDYYDDGNDDQDEQGDRQECKTNHHGVVDFRTEGLQRLDPAKSNWRLNVIVVSVIRFGYF